MKILISVFLSFFLFQDIASAAETLLFIEIPKYVSAGEAITDIRHAAVNRKWTIIDAKSDKLKISLDHRGYQAVLEFFVSKGNIGYIDSSKYYTISKNWVNEPVPDNWIDNLKKDTNNYFHRRFLNKNKNSNAQQKDCVTTATLENVEKRLKGLKTLYGKGLITEKEYKNKKKEILTKY